MTATDIAAAHALLVQLSTVLRKRAYAKRTIEHSMEEEKRLVQELMTLGVTDISAFTDSAFSRHPDDRDDEVT